MSDLTPDSPETETSQSETSQSETPQPPPAAAKTRRLINTVVIGLAGLMGIAIVIYFVMWFYAADKIEQGVDRFLAESNAQGNRIAVKSITTSGFPGKIRLDIEKIDAFIFGGETIRIPTLNAEARAWSWRRVDFAMPDGMHLVTHTPVIDAVDIDTLHGHAYFGRLDGLPVINIAATQTQFTLSPPLITAVTDYRRELLAHHLNLSFMPDAAGAGADAFRFRIRGEVIGLLDDGAAEISEETHYIEKLDIDAFMPVPPPSRLTRERLAQWRMDGGEIQVENIEVTWWPVHMIGGGTIGLDEMLQPSGKLDLEITGFDTLIDMIAAAGLMTAKTREMAHMGLGLMAKRREGSDTPFINVPLMIRNNAVSLGPVPIMRLEPIVWPGEARVLRR